jgi:hypothetical protein
MLACPSAILQHGMKALIGFYCQAFQPPSLLSSEPDKRLLFYKLPSILFLFFLSVLGYELRASPLLGRHSTTWGTPPTLFCIGYFGNRVSQSICRCWPQTVILLISASRVARIQPLAFCWCYGLDMKCPHPQKAHVLKDGTQCSEMESWKLIVLRALVQSVIRRLPNSLSCMEESVGGHMSVKGVHWKLGMRNARGSMVGAGGVCQLRNCASLSPGAFRVYTNLWERRNQMILIQ